MVNTENQDTPVLGGENKQIILDDIAANRETMLSMLHQVKRELLFCSLILDPPLLNNSEAIDAIRSVIANNRNFRMRALIFNPALLTKTGNRLLGFGRSKPSFFSFRTPSQQHASFDQMMFLVDGVGFIHRPKCDLWRGVANFNDKRRVQHYKETFETIWANGEPDQELRQFRM